MFLYTFRTVSEPVRPDTKVCWCPTIFGAFPHVCNPMDAYGVQRNGARDVGERDVMSGWRVIDGSDDLGK